MTVRQPAPAVVTMRAVVARAYFATFVSASPATKYAADSTDGG
jgi:hypothetical protein